MSVKLPPVSRALSSNPADLKNGTLVPYGQKPVESGPSYSLGGSNIIYKLPQPKNLKPYVDTTAGVLDTWPAHAPGKVQNTPLTNEPRGVSKPKFLDHLENFLQKELRALDCTESKSPTEKRLQAFREVFECLIDDFKTYRPLLSAIKNEYELTIVAQREKIRELEPYKASLVTVSEQCEQKLVAAKQDERVEMIELKKENEKLKSIIREMREEHVSLSGQVKKLQYDIAEEYRKFRDESDARKLLIHDLNDLRYQNMNTRATSMMMDDGDNEGSGQEDPVIMRIALRKAREDLESKTMQLAEVMANYGDVVPRRDHEKLEKDFSNLKDEMKDLANDYAALSKDHSVLIQIHKQVLEQRDQYLADCEELRRSGTPRPNWAKCEQYIEGGKERWDVISHGKTTDGLVNVLLSEMTGQDIAFIEAGAANHAEYFETMGVGEDVPLPFRWEGKVLNRRLSRRDVLLLIRDIWKTRVSLLKSTSSEEANKKQVFLTFLAHYLRSRYGSENLAVEWAYNIQDACQRYQTEFNIGIFNDILNEQLDEEVFHDNMMLLGDLLKSFKSLDEGNKGYLSKDEFRSSLASSFPLKPKEAIDGLIYAAESEIGSSTEQFPYANLLAESEDGQYGSFVVCIMEQRRSEKAAFLRLVEEKLKGKSNIKISEAKDILKSMDVNLSDEKCRDVIDKGFRSNAETGKQVTDLEIPKLIENLKRSSLSL